MTLKHAARTLDAFISLVPPGEAWRDRGIVSASVYDSGEGWNLIVVFREQRYYKYIPNSFGKLRVVKRTAS